MHASNPSRLSLAEQCSYCQPMDLAPARLVRGDPRARRDRRRRAGHLAMAMETLEKRTLMSISPLAAALPVGNFSPTAAQITDSGAARIAAAANGDFVVVWQNESNSTIELEYRLFDSSGNALTGATAVDGTATDPVIQKSSTGGVSQLQTSMDPRYFDVAMDAAGDFVIAWQGQSQIFAERFNSSGATEGSLITVSTGTANTEPSVAMDAAGDFTVAWIDDQAASVYIQTMTPKSSYQNFYNEKVTTTTNTGSHYATATNYVSGVVEARRFDSAGTGGDTIAVNDAPVTGPAGKASTSFSTDLSPSVAMDQNGDFVVGWAQSNYAPAKIQTAHSYHYSQTGSYYDQATSKYINYTLNSYTAATFTYTMALSGFNEKFQRYNAPASAQADPAPNGATGTALAVNSTPKQFVNGSDVAVSMDSAGDFAITSDLSYAKETTRTPTGQQYTYSYYQSSSVISSKLYKSTGAAVGGAITVAKTALSPAPGEQSSIPSPLLDGALPAMNSSGELAVAWNQYTYNSSGNDFTGIFARRYSSSGAPLDAAPVQLGADDDAGATNPDISYAGAGTLDLAYTETDQQDGVFPVVAQQLHDTTATQLKLIATPKSLTAGVSGSLGVNIDDAKGNPVSAETGNVTVTILTGPDAGASLTTAANAGVAEFSLNFTSAGVYTLQVAYGSLTKTTGNITVNPGAAAQLTILDEPPATGIAGAKLASAVKAELLDSFGNVATTDKSKVTLSIASSSASGSRLTGTVTAAVSKGIATFAAFELPVAGDYTLKAADTRNATLSATTGSIMISAAAAAKLAFLEPPQSVAANADITPPVVVAVEDKFGNIVTTGTSSTSNITISLGSEPKHAVLTPASPTVAAQNGTAAFSDLALSLAGRYSLKATDGRLTRTSPQFTVT